MLRTRSPRKEKISNCYLHSNSLSNKMDNSLLAVRDINHKYIVVGRNLDITSRGVIGGDDYTMTHAIARGARKHGYDSITFMSAKNSTGVNTDISNPANVKVEEILR